MFLSYWPTEVGLLDGKKVIDDNISLDIHIVNVLRKI